MISFFRLKLAIIFAAISPTIVGSQPFETEQLFRKGAWSVEITYDAEDGRLWCSAATNNRYYQSLSVVAYETGKMALFVFDSDWELKPRPVEFVVDIDYSRWSVSGSSSESGVSVELTDVNKTAQFLSELQQGNAVAVYNDDLQRLATFSLSGSSAAITSLMDCWDKISSRKDPFGNSDDPFGASADPF